MPTPHYNFRLPKDQARRLEEVAKIYGTNTSAFLREMIGAICGGTPEGPAPFLQKLGMALGQQRQLELFAASEAQKPATRRQKRKRRRRGST
jgi:hypothetical protein